MNTQPRRRRFRLSLYLFLYILVSLAATNPNATQFKDFIAKQKMGASGSAALSVLQSVLDESITDEAIVRRNFLVISLYTFKAEPDKQYVGWYNTFWALPW